MTREPTTRKSTGRTGGGAFGALVGALFLVASLGLVAAFAFWASPKTAVELPDYFTGYDPEPMQAAMEVDAVSQAQQAILEHGDRFLGLPGYFATREELKRRFEEAGLEVVEQHFRVPAPVTAVREFFVIDEETGDERPVGVDVHPLVPNSFQPVVTPDGGIEGVLTLLTREEMDSARDFSDVIGIVDAVGENHHPEFAGAWYRYANLGIKGMIITQSEGLDELSTWFMAHRTGLGSVSGFPVNYPRFLASPDILALAGKRVRIRTVVRYENVPASNLFGVLRAENPTREALIINTHYDVCTTVPDASRAPLQALQIATQLQLLEGLLPYRETLQRDVIFLSYGARYAGAAGMNSLMQVLQVNRGRGVDLEDRSRMAWIVERQEANEAQAQQVAAVLGLLTDPRFLVDVEHSRELRDSLESKTRRFFDDQLGYVLDTLVFRKAEEVLQRKVDFERAGGTLEQGDSYATYQAERRIYESIASASNYSLINLLREKADFAEEYRVRELVVERFEELRAYHGERRHELESYAATFELFHPYRAVGFFDPSLAPAAVEEDAREVLSYSTHMFSSRGVDASFTSLLSAARARLGLTGNQIEIPKYDTWHSDLAGSHVGDMDFRYAETIYTILGYSTVRFLNFDRKRSYGDFVAPTDEPFMHDLSSLKYSFKVLGETINAIAHGAGVLPPGLVNAGQVHTFGGRVLASNVGLSSVPDYPLKDALVGPLPRDGNREGIRDGYNRFIYTFTNPYGEFDMPNTVGDFRHRLGNGAKGYSPVAVTFGEDGMIQYIKDKGEEGQRLYKSVNLDVRDKASIRNVTIVTFRASPVSILDLTNPQTFGEFAGVRFIRQDGMSAFRKQFTFGEGSFETAFLEPDRRFYVELRAGAPDNELVRITRAFMLGIDEETPLDPNREISGPGYLVADHPILQDVPFEIAKSMAYLNGRRLTMQRRYDMADRRTVEYSEKTDALLATARDTELSRKQATVTARDAVTYAQQNHPVLRDSINEAVIGIVWYLALLVPFIFFLEKLIFAYSDIRKQIAAQAVIFLAVFVALRLLHPAFLMVRSSLMILLGFIIVMISWGITFLFSGKFQENFEELRRRSGRVSEAEVDKVGVMITAFMLGLNNMNRRKVRTGLTCATLVLLTFVMICFTSTQDELLEENIALGKAPYQGMLVRKESFRGLNPSEIAAIRAKFGDRFEISRRHMLLGRENWQERLRLNPTLQIVFNDGETERKREFSSILQLDFNEPLRDQIRYLTEPRWWGEYDGAGEDDPIPVLIPDRMAELLGISVSAVNESPVRVKINGGDFAVRGIFDSAHLANLRDIDGYDLLPFDIEALEAVQVVGGQVLAPPDAPRIPASDIIIASGIGLGGITIPNGGGRSVSVAVSMPGVAYRDVREVIEQFMEQTGETLYYGLDGVAYQGKRARTAGLGFGIDLIIPLIIGAITVLNTMRGSVYERRDEIYIYNSVGIAPRYIFFMFIAEALVYAVIGTVLGFIFSQGIGRILSALEMTGGMQMDFTSISTIYVSLAVAASVVISTWFPARTAMEIASPAEESGWEVPQPEGTVLAFDLPFNLRHRGRIAVLEFFRRYLSDHGEGSSGRYFAGPPEMGVEVTPEGRTPYIECTIWLKPYDQGVSQRLRISIPPDPDTGLFKAHVSIELLSGSRQAWERLNSKFLVLIRKHFLHWRAVPDEERDFMFEEAREQLRRIAGLPPRDIDPHVAESPNAFQAGNV